jgi:DNA replication protein DnaC
MATKTIASARDVSSEISYLTRALKAPTLRESAARLAERARAENWSHEEYLAAYLQREVSARESHGGEGRIRAAQFPARKSLEEFDFDHARGLKRDTIAHLGRTGKPFGRLAKAPTSVCATHKPPMPVPLPMWPPSPR